RRFRRTSARAGCGLTPHSGVTRVTIVLSIADWPRQPQLPVRIESDTSTLATVTIPAQPRRVLALLPPGATALRLHTPVARPPGGDWRWLGVQVLGVDAQPTGLPLHTLLQALLLAGLSGLLALGMAWAIPPRHGSVVPPRLLGVAPLRPRLAGSP